jgi:hypothetical protein
MPDQLLLYIGASITFIWGIAHLFPTTSVVKGFGDIAPDSKNIITMEWIAEGVTLIFIGIIVAGVTFIDADGSVSEFIFIASAVMLLVLAVVSLFTGFKVNFLPFKLCPFLFTFSAVLIIIGRQL